MVRGGGGGGRLVAATIAQLEKQQYRQQHNKQPVDNDCKENVDSSMDESSTTLKCNSSTDSGKDDHSLITSNSSTSSNSNEDLDTICCKSDFQWMISKEAEDCANRIKEENHLKRGRELTRRDEKLLSPNLKPEIRLRKTSTSLDRSARRSTRRERDHKCRSSNFKYLHSPTRHQRECYHDYPLQYIDYGERMAPPSPHHDCRIPYFYRPPLPCDYPYRYLAKPTTELQEQLRRLESDKESLSLQVAVLTDQVDAQSEKINDLEKALSEQKRQLTASEDLLQREMLTRSSLETQKLELLAVVSELKRHETALERDNMELRDRLAEEKRRNKPPLAPRSHLYPTASTPTNLVDMTRGISPSPSPVSLVHSPRKHEYNDISPSFQKIGGGQYRSLPREHQTSGELSSARRAVVFAETEIIVVNEKEREDDSYHKEPSPSLQGTAPKGIRKILGRIKRSGSGNLDDIPTEEPFTRGGVRSTAGPRLCGDPQVSFRSDKPFAEWTTDNICDWLKEMGLDGSLTEAKRWVKSGQTLLSATPHEIDKELNIKNALLRKKLHLCLEAERGSSGSGGDPMLEWAGRLEPGWVLRWLDDIGLPQYKAAFMSARLDGRVLHRLTLDDVHGLHIGLALHLASIRAGIQVLRKEKFDPHCLVRRSDPENEADERVELWTNHRVMEWLRVVDLAEYAPNLRGSGVHGGLMVHEERFTDTLLASLLSIPSEKTLLRRHLSTHFKELLGSEIIQKKRETEATLGYVPLTTNLKIKIPKKSQFTLKRKKSKYDLEDGELVCPLNESNKSNLSAGDCSPDLSKSPNHVAASPDKSSLSSQSSSGKKKNDQQISDV
ncbi:liprin-beta 1 isoform X3 [Rhodnius prolixus]|uniref:liprin-beta 1 isoform X3 n=1 Tax=Rhodnius prolixus TaxID=13249 RepID=UPI003D18824B